MVVRETEEEAKAAANKIISKLDDSRATEIKGQSQDAKSQGVQRQDQLRGNADTGVLLSLTFGVR